MYIPGFITVRTSSTRLPNKCLLPFGENCNVLEHIIRRTRHFNIEPIICTSVDSTDDIIEKIAISEGVKFFRGSLVNKLKRWSDCATYFDIDVFHTVDADDPFFDGEEMKKSYTLCLNGNWGMVCPTISSSSGGASVGYTLMTKVLDEAIKGLSEDTDTESILDTIDKVPGLRKIMLPEQGTHPSNMRLTLDYHEDYWLLESVRRIVGNFATRKTVDSLFLRNPDLYKINWFRNNEWKQHQLDKKL